MTCEKIRLTRGAPPLGFLNQRKDKLVELVFQAMVGVERDVDRITLCGAMNVLRDRDCAERHVLKRRARSKRGAAGGDLNDPVALALRKPAQHRIRGSE